MLVIDEEFSEVLLNVDAVKEIPYVSSKQPMTEPNVEVHEDDDAIYLFTSGTTGRGKSMCNWT